MVKTCSKCGVEKDCSEFYRKSGSDILRSDCKDCVKKMTKSNRQENPIDRREYRQRYDQREDVKVKKRWRKLLLRLLNVTGKRKAAKTEEMLGYSADELNKHLSALNENWKEYQIDHKIPISWFKEDTPVHIVNDLRNLQLLSSKENISKGNSYADEVPEEYKKIVESFLK